MHISTGQPTVKYGYSRLKRIFTKNFKYTGYNDITDTAKNKILGNIPTELLNEALKTNNKEATIKKIQKGFAQAANELLKIQTERSSVVKNIKPEKSDVMKTYSYLLDGDYQQREFLKNKLERSILSADVIQKHEQAAIKVLKNSMFDILPKGTKINLKSIGVGNFAEAYKIEFRDQNNQQLFKDYTMKLYKDRNESAKINIELNKKIKEALYSLEDNEIKELYHSCPIYKNGTAEDWKRIIEKFREENKPAIDGELSTIEKLYTLANFAQCSNGVRAEANTYFYIKNAIGHDLTKTNLNKHYMFDIENRFNISDYSNYSLPPVKKHVNFSQIGMVPIDAYDNYSNIVCRRIIDVGGMSKNDNILTDKTVRKFYKKIVNRNTTKEREAVIENLKQIASNPKTPDRNKILTAIKYAEAKCQSKKENLIRIY